MRYQLIVMIAIGIIGYQTSHAANNAFDSAADPAYSAGWTNGSNGGFGFGPWILTSLGTNVLFVIQSSTVNGDGDSNADGDIDTSGVSWGLASGDASLAYAFRPFTGGDLAAGETFFVDFDFGYNYDPAKSGLIVGFFDGPLTYDVFSLSVFTNSPVLHYSDAENFNVPLPIGNNDEGYRLTFTMTGPTSYQATVTSKLTGLSHGWSGTLAYAPGIFVAANSSPETGSTDNPYRLYINSMEVVPEPNLFALVSVGAVALGIGRTIRRKS